ncbi:MAG: HDIG domain-containing protein [Deltaproteobacteria bacterium]|nr:HDIG domain-containing protein [Deltaproteobacteria bacterium]
MLLAAVITSLVLAGVLTMDFLPTGAGGLIPRSGEIADRSYKAPSDIHIVDEAATEEHRRDAAEQAVLVYDFDERRWTELQERMVAAFREARAALLEEPKEVGDKPEPARIFREALGEETEVPDSAIERLVKSKFDPEQEALLLTLISSIAARMVVDDASEFQRQAEKRAIVVRELGSGMERVLAEKSEVLTLSAARELLREEALKVFAGRPREERRTLLALAALLVRPNLSFNLRASDERRQAAEEGVKEVMISLRKGEIVVRDGDPVTERHVLILEGIREQVRSTSRAERFLGTGGLLFILLFLVWRFGASGIQRFPTEPRDAVFLLSMLTTTAVGTSVALFLCDAVAQSPAVTHWVGPDPSVLYFVIPVAAATMLVRLVHSAETALLFAILVSLMAGLQIRGELTFAFYVLAGSLTAARSAARVTQRGTLLIAGVRVGVVNVLVIGVLALLGGQLNPGTILLSMGLGFISGPIAGVLVLGLAPLVESLFSYTTDVKLLELANREQVLLRELEFRAPGTYHHSMMVGHLAEKAAEGIGANALLAKVAGYYHDIGKMRRPHFFIENATVHRGENRHEKLSPSMSARIIQSHVKDGLEYGDKYKLARPIMRGIAEHHGTSIIRFFFEKAKEMADPEKGEVVAEYDYRYPGPKPQTREAGILMLADSVEAASRTLADPARSRVQQLVQRIINNYFRDGQLDECSLTLRDLHTIARSFIDTLCAIRHERIDYPEATGPEGKKLDEGVNEGVVERIEPGPKDRSERASAEREADLKRLGLPR